MTERRIPQSLEAEQSTLGACLMMDTGAIVAAMEILKGDEFYREMHKKIWAAITTLFGKGEPVDITTLPLELKRRNQLEDVGGFNYLEALILNCPSSANVAAYATKVQELFVLRELLIANEKNSGAIYEGEQTADEALQAHEQSVLSIAQRRVKAESFAVRDLIADQRRRIIETAANPQAARGVLTGLYDLDAMTNGLKDSHLIVTAAASSMGKSALASQFGYHAAKTEQRPVIVFSLEVTKEEWVDRMASCAARVDGTLMSKGELSDEDFSRLDTAQERIAALPIHIFDTPSMTSYDICSTARGMAMRYGKPALVIIDYLQLAGHVNTKLDERMKVTNLVREFKQLARELKCPVNVLSQLNREVDRREDKRPRKSDLRESSAIENEADLLLFVYRPRYYKAEAAKDSGKTWGPEIETDEDRDEIIIGKQRNGPTGTVYVKFQPEYVRFESHAR